MDYPSLYRLLPSYFKPVGLIVSIFSVSLAIYLKVAEEENVLFMTLRATQLILLISLIIYIMSKEKIEDERIDLLRLEISFSGYAGLLAIIILNEIELIFREEWEAFDILSYAILFNIYLVVFYELVKRTNFIEWLEKRAFVNSIVNVVFIYTLVRFLKWLWGM